MGKFGRKPKDAAKYLLPTVAASRLINAALENVLWQRHGTRVKWTLKVDFFQTKDYKPGEEQLVVPGGFTMSSGDPVPADAEASLSGHKPAEEPAVETAAV